MKKLYTIPDCIPCKEIKEWIEEQTFELQIIDLVKIDNEWHEKIEDGFVKFDKSINSFPCLLVGSYDNKQNIYVIGKEGIISILEKGYLYESKYCPFINKACYEKKCAKFVIMTKGPILEGGCSDYWTPIILTEILTKGK